MFKRTMSSCSCSGDCTHSVLEEDVVLVVDTDEEDLPMMSPKLEMGLSRQLTQRASISGSTSSSVDVGVDPTPFPPASERLKPQPFRRKEPALHFQAAVRGDAQDLNKFLLDGGDPDSRDEQGWALLHHATVSLESWCAAVYGRLSRPTRSFGWPSKLPYNSSITAVRAKEGEREESLFIYVLWSVMPSLMPCLCSEKVVAYICIPQARKYMIVTLCCIM